MRSGATPALQALATPSPAVPDMVITMTDPPAEFDAEAAHQWREVAQVLIDRRTLSKGDLPTLRNYIRLGVLIREATISADWRLVGKLIGTQTRLARELGLTPSSRESFRPAPPADEIDDVEALKRGEFAEPGTYRRLRDCD